MPAKKLTPEQRADAARLKAEFETWKVDRKAAGRPGTQEFIAHELGFKTQSAVSQYMNGNIPLNGDALRKFAQLFGVAPSAISPRIVAVEIARANTWLGDAAQAGGVAPPASSVKPLHDRYRAGRPEPGKALTLPNKPTTRRKRTEK